jgi:hypothetical protein
VFTGIVEEIGEVVAVHRTDEVLVLTVHGPTVCSDARHGDSIAVSGVCLTVTDASAADGTFRVELVPETLARSSLAGVVEGTRVNLERAVAAGGPHRPGPRRRGRQAVQSRPGRPQRRAALHPSAWPRAVRRGEGLDHGGRGLADGRGH